MQIPLHSSRLQLQSECLNVRVTELDGVRRCPRNNESTEAPFSRLEIKDRELCVRIF